MSDYVPRSDSDFDKWQLYLLQTSEEHATEWNISADVIAALKPKQAAWTTNWHKADNHQNRTQADVLAKNESRNDYTIDLRHFVSQYLTFNDKVDDSDRERMGLTIRSTSRTPVSVPSSYPIASIDFSTRMQHIIRIADNDTPTRRGKPDGVRGCEIWMKVGGEPPKDFSELKYVATTTTPTHQVQFEGNQTGMVVYYWFRWVNTRQQAGPWSAMVSAAIG